MSLWEIGFWGGIFMAAIGFAGVVVSTLLLVMDTYFFIDSGEVSNTIKKKEEF